MYIQTPIESALAVEIESALNQLRNTQKGSEEYGALVEHISKLHKLKTEEQIQQLKSEEQDFKLKTEEWYKRVSPDTVLVAAVNIFGILWITRYEKENIINSKALNFGLKFR